MQISASLPSAAPWSNAGVRPAASRVPYDIAAARAESLDEKRRAEAIEARNADGIASLASQGMTMSQGSYTMLYKEELARSIDTDSDGAIGVEELAAKMGVGEDLARAARLHEVLDADGDGRLGLSEFGDSVRDPFRDASFRRQLTQSGQLDPSAMGALFRRHAAQYDATAVLGAMSRSIDTAA